MSYDMFGDLREWGRVLDQVQQLREDGALDNHQAALARLARYPYNWRLRQAGLRAIAGLERPADEVLRIAVRIMIDDRIDLDTRILAGAAVNAILGKAGATISDGARYEAARSVQDLFSKPHPPVLRNFEPVVPPRSSKAIAGAQ